MVRFISLLKRRDGMTLEQFRDYYENHHSKLLGALGREHRSAAVCYTRTYLRPALHPIEQPTAGVDYDVIMELVYPDRASLDADMTFLGSDGIRSAFAEDEDRLFDRQYSRCYIVDEEFSAGPRS